MSAADEACGGSEGVSIYGRIIGISHLPKELLYLMSPLVKDGSTATRVVEY